VSLARILKSITHARWALILLVPLSTACSTQTYLTIHSQPDGAEVFEGNERWGVTPVTLDYTSATRQADNGCVATRPISVRWDSGAKARVSTINVCANAAGEVTYTFVYPQGYHGDGQGAEPEVAARATRAVTPDGQLYYDVAQPGGDSVVKCFSNMRGDQVITHCGG